MSVEIDKNDKFINFQDDSVCDEEKEKERNDKIEEKYEDVINERLNIRNKNKITKTNSKSSSSFSLLKDWFDCNSVISESLPFPKPPEDYHCFILVFFFFLFINNFILIRFKNKIDWKRNIWRSF
jgi:hypothetical protein